MVNSFTIDHGDRFPALLREVEAQKAALRVRSYGLSITTMEEVLYELPQLLMAVHVQTGT